MLHVSLCVCVYVYACVCGVARYADAYNVRGRADDCRHGDPALLRPHDRSVLCVAGDRSAAGVHHAFPDLRIPVPYLVRWWVSRAQTHTYTHTHEHMCTFVHGHALSVAVSQYHGLAIPGHICMVCVCVCVCLTEPLPPTPVVSDEFLEAREANIKGGALAAQVTAREIEKGTCGMAPGRTHKDHIHMHTPA